MGCFWSSESVSEYQRSQYVTNAFPRTETQSRPHPVLGEYRCSMCGRTWQSRLCRPNSYQNCKRCKNPVYSHKQRELLPSDKVSSDGKQEHPKELCQVCQQLGYYCGNMYKNRPSKR